MPYITVEGGQLTIEQKEQLSDKNIGIGGKCIDVVKSEYMAKHK